MNRLNYWLWTACGVAGLVATDTIISTTMAFPDQGGAMGTAAFAYVIALGILRYKRALDVGQHPIAWAILGAIPVLHLILGCIKSKSQITANLEQALAD
jgi:hypothetical protein